MPAELIHNINLISLDGEFAQVVETGEFLEEMNKSKKKTVMSFFPTTYPAKSTK